MEDTTKRIRHQTDNRQSFRYIIYRRSTGGTWCGCSKPASSTSRTLTCATRPSRGGHTLYIHYTISTELYLLYLQHFIFHIYSTISTPYLQYYIHHTQAGPAHIHAVRASLPRPRRRPRLSSCSFSLRDYVLEK